MKPYADRSVTIIGLGYLMEYIFPCFKKSMGEKTRSQINAVTADKEDYLNKSERLGIPVLLEDNKMALETMEPDMIFFAPPPSKVKELVEVYLKPYYDGCRAEEKKIPKLFCFPPNPPVDYYVEILGDDVCVVNIIPNMRNSVGDDVVVDVSDEGCHFLTFPAKDNWSDEEKEAMEEFFLPMGSSITVPSALILDVLSAEICTHPLTEMADIAARVFSEQKLPTSYRETAAVLRGFHQKYTGYRSPNSNCYDDMAVTDPIARQRLERTVNTWHSALLNFLLKAGFPQEDSLQILNPMFDMYFHEAQVERRETIVQKAKNDATKGGMLELCMESYYAILENLLADYYRGGEDRLLYEMHQTLQEIAKAVVERGRGLTDVQVTVFTPKQHAVMFALLAKHTLAKIGKEGDDLLYLAVQRYGEERGKRMAERAITNGAPLNMATYRAFGEWSHEGDFEKEAISVKPYSAYRVLACPWSKAWEETGLSEYGRYYCRVVDESILRGFSTNLRLEMPKYYGMDGGNYCEFHWQDQIEDEEFSSEYNYWKEFLGGSAIKDFVYHTAHIYFTVFQVLQEKVPKQVNAIKQAVRIDFAKICSNQAFLKILPFTWENFSKAQG